MGAPFFVGAPVRPNMLNMPNTASANEWQLAISNEKCRIWNIGNQMPTPRLHLDNGILPVVPLARDLGYTC